MQGNVVLALDLARTAGWACGAPCTEPAHGSVQFASAGSSHEACFLGAFKWADTTIKMFRPSVIVWESPLQTSFRRGTTNSNTTTLLYGLPAVIGLAAYLQGAYDCRKADTKDVRTHFIGSNPKRVKAKPMVMQQCRALGWEVVDDNEADALAVWSYMCSLIEPKLALRPVPLFARRA